MPSGKYLKSPEQKQKISLTLTGRTLSEATKMKMSLAAFKRLGKEPQPKMLQPIKLHTPPKIQRLKICYKCKTEILKPTFQSQELLSPKHFLNNGQNPKNLASKIGYSSEILVCLDLFKKGFDIYQDIVPNSSFDYLIRSSKTQQYYRLEIGTAHKLPGGKIQSTKTHRGNIKPSVFNKCDFVALAYSDGSIEYFPNAPS